MPFDPPPVWLLPPVIAALVAARWLWRQQMNIAALSLTLAALLGTLFVTGYRAVHTPRPYALATPVELVDIAGRPHGLPSEVPAPLVLWRSDCQACRARLSQLAELPDEERRQWRLVNQGEALLTVQRYVDNTHPNRFADRQILLDPRQRLWAQSGEPSLPTIIAP
ncbi:hypothetical protein [Kushneria aurantia]|uniref:Thioredoxin domain-containing protein n=1 Tax=Kushneria aurantia TaxID=504092 RepID=A0ABV6G5N4_9GAMM|nr:hypothetical protein [Kushneria aurantia]